MPHRRHRKSNPYRVAGCAVESRRLQHFHGNVMDRLGRNNQIDDLRSGVVIVAFPRVDWFAEQAATPLADFEAMSAFVREHSIPIADYYAPGGPHDASQLAYALDHAGWLPPSVMDTLAARVAMREIAAAKTETLEKGIRDAFLTEIEAKYPVIREKAAKNEPIQPIKGSVFGKMETIERLKEDFSSGKITFRSMSFPPDPPKEG